MTFDRILPGLMIIYFKDKPVNCGRSRKAIDKELRKELGLLEVIMITTGSMIAAGLFVLPGIAYARTGPAVVLSFGIAATIALPTVLSAAELSTAMPKAGGVYYFVSRGVGYSAGSIAGFARWLSIGLKSAYALLGFGYYTSGFTSLDPKYTALIVCLLFIFINLVGLRIVGITQVLLTAVLLGLLTFIVISGAPAVAFGNFVPFAPEGFGSVLATAGFIFISYGGMLVITGLAEEVKRPRRNIPLGMILGLVITGIIYVAVVIVIVGNMDATSLTNTLTPVADTAKINLGYTGFLVASAAALLAFITTANAGIASASRYPLAMSRDLLLPVIFQNTTVGSKMPYVTIILTGILMLVAIGFVKMESLVEIASSLLMITYILTNLALLLLRKRNHPHYKPTFQAPLYPWLQALSIAGLSLLLVQTGMTAVISGLIFCLAAYGWYLIRARFTLENHLPLPPEPKK